MKEEFSFPKEEVSIQEYFQFFYNKEPHVFLDVRDTWEVEIVCIEGSRHIPLTLLLNHLNELPEDSWVISYCHHGIRSLRACRLLRQQGFAKVVSLEGGIDRWAREVDKTLPTY
jgi:rhodanese-related sulfurtransferase